MQYTTSQQSKICGVPNMQEQQLKYNLLLAKGKVITQAQNLVCGKANEQDRTTWEFESLAVTEYFLGLGYCDLYSPWGWLWQTIGEIGKVSSMYLCKKYGHVKKVKWSYMLLACSHIVPWFKIASSSQCATY